jgi:hypothetical protein
MLCLNHRDLQWQELNAIAKIFITQHFGHERQIVDCLTNRNSSIPLHDLPAPYDIHAGFSQTESDRTADVDVHVVSEWHDYGPDRACFFREGLDSDSARNLSARSSCIRITASKVSE